MEEEKQPKKTETNILQKSGNIHELLKAGKNSNINFDISRLSGKGFSNLLEKAKKLQELKVKEEKSVLETKKEEFDSIIKKGKETLKKNNISLTKIPDNFELLKKFSQRFSSRKTNNKINNILTSTDTQNNLKEENYYGITTTSNTNTNSNINSNFNTEKTKTKESIDIGNESKNESKNEKEKDKDNDESSIEYIKRTERSYKNMEKRKYFHFYSIFNNLSSKNNNKINIKSKLKPRNKNITILNPDSLYQKSDNIDDTEENNKKNNENDKNDNELENNSIKYIDENDINDNKIIDDINYTDNIDNLDNSDNINDNNKSKNNNKSNNINDNNYKKKSNKQENSNFYEYQPGPSPSSTYYIANDIDNNNNSFENDNENYEKNNDSENYVNSNSNSFKIYQKNNLKNTTEDLNFENDESENNDNKEEDNNSKVNILNFDEDENNNDIIDIESKAIEYETVNSNYSIKQCNSVLEYSFREDQNISYCSLMEDKSKSIENFNNNKKQMLFQLFDGYKGEEIPNFLQQNFTHIYKQYLEETKQNIPRSLVKTFKETDEIIKKLPNIEGKCSTGTVIHIIWENKNKLMVYSGNVGNTKACLVSPVYVIKLTEDQETPEIKYIKMKLKNKKNHKNLKINNVNEDSKVFGNYKINEEDEMDIGRKKYYKNRNKKYNNSNNNNKNEESEKKNRHCVPYIAKMEIDLSIKNQFLFLGSDGIWDRVDEDELQYLIESNQDTEQLCSIIVKNVLRRDTTKNISIFAIKLT